MLVLVMLVQQAPPTGLWLMGGALLMIVLLGAAGLLLFSLRRMLRGGNGKSGDNWEHKPSTDNPSAFMTASMQAVIQKLRDQEKELAALHRQDRERAEQTEKLSETVTHNMPAGLLLINSAGLITSANPAAETALGVRGLAYRRYTDVLGTDTPLSRLATQCLSDARTFRRQEVTYLTPAGEPRLLGVTISPIVRGAGGSVGGVTGAICLLSDLTELAALQRQVKQKENLAALGELSAGIAHEFKNALGTISGYAQLIRGEAQGEVRENAQQILDQTRSLAHVVSEFLKFARPLDLSTEDVPVQPLLERVAAQVRDSVPDVKITMEGNFENVSADSALLGQALLNLVRNAAEAAGARAGGRVILRGAMEKTGAGRLQRISVCDNGPGIPAAEMNKIFVPFYTTKTNGTGLGLAIVQKIVVQHGGSVEARNQPGGGAELVVWLPVGRERPVGVDYLAART